MTDQTATLLHNMGCRPGVPVLHRAAHACSLVSFGLPAFGSTIGEVITWSASACLPPKLDSARPSAMYADNSVPESSDIRIARRALFTGSVSKTRKERGSMRLICTAFHA